MCERGLFRRPVQCPDPVGALEGHVFEHVDHPTQARRLVAYADVDEGLEGDDGGSLPRKEEEGPAVLQVMLNDNLLQGLWPEVGVGARTLEGEQETERDGEHGSASKGAF